ncbi:MAG: hypothetical protein H0Z35_02100 [Thermoanaerobacteraceae bacterium]|nr:hypothetical protein [Thermoanaerobacteraceae bacterium]
MRDKFEQKKKLLEKFLEFTNEQTRVIENRNYEQLFYILNEKQSIIEQVNLIDAEIKAFGETEVPRDLEEDIKNILSEAIARDEQNKELIQQNKAEIVEKIRNISKKKKTHSLYRGKHVAIEGVLLDKKG